MKGTDRAVLISFLAIGLLVGFYMMALAPKRQEASKLGDEVAELEASIVEQEQLATFAQQARDDFPTFYGRMVALGKAVPEDADTASLLVQLNSISTRTGVDFVSLQLAQGGASTGTPPAAPAAPAEAAPATTEGAAPPPGESGEAAPTEGAPAEGSTAATTTGTTPAPATETAASTLPIGATVGAAGLPTLPYDVDFEGNFFEVADFVDGLDEMIQLRGKKGNVTVDGRLMTVDGFALKGGAPGSSPDLEASFVLTTYITPEEQGLTLGATPEGPAPAPGQPPLTQTSTVSP